MRLPRSLTSLDDRLLGDRFRRRPAADDAGPDPVDRTAQGRERPSTGEGAAQAFGVVCRVSRLVFLLLAAAVALGAVFVLAPTNADNAVVELVDDVASGAAGPFRDVFRVEDPDREVVVNDAFAAVVYLVAAALVVRLPGARRS